MSVETTFCSLNLVSLIVHPRFTCVSFLFLDTSRSAAVDTPVQSSEQGTVSMETTFCYVNFIIHAICVPVFQFLNTSADI